MKDSLFPMLAPESRPLNALELARLEAAGGGAPEIEACEAVPDKDRRSLLIEFFCDACPHNWRKLQLMVALMLYKEQCKDARPIGGDIITNAAKFHFAECEGCNNHRLLYPRALAIVCPDLRTLGLLEMDADAKANVLFECGWPAPDSVDWQAIKPATLGVIRP